jgi:REP element-mobilizing transposase RayT
MFLDRLKTSVGIYEVRVHAYVLMSNHFHMIVETPKGNLSEFMRHFNISYTAAYNRRHSRVGHLYQGRFKAILIDADNYLLELSRYVHLNPVRVASYKRKDDREKFKDVEGYQWSSVGGYLGSLQKQFWITYDTVLDYLGGAVGNIGNLSSTASGRDMIRRGRTSKGKRCWEKRILSNESRRE